MLLFLHALLCLGISPTGAVPSFHIDLDLAPEKRWVNVAKYYKTELIGMHKALSPLLKRHLGKAGDSWLQVADFGSEYEGELKGIADTVNDPGLTVEGLKMSNMLFELQSPTACAGVLWAMANGTVIHGRNMDYAFHFDTPGGTLNWPNVTFEATFMKAGKPIFIETAWPGSVGIHTAMRFNGWGFQQNTRENTVNDWRLNLAAAKAGGQAYALVARRIMETTPNFEDAVQKLYATKYMAPQYFVVSGAAPFQGAVLTIDRHGDALATTPPLQKLNKSTSWHLVQTNDDLLDKPLDVRRPLANRMLSAATQDIVTTDHLMEFMHSSPLLWNGTVFSTVMEPATGFYKTTLPHEPPGQIERKLFAKADYVGLVSDTEESEPINEKPSSFLAPKKRHSRNKDWMRTLATRKATQQVLDEVSFMQLPTKMEV